MKRLNIYWSAFLSVLISSYALAQHPTCDGTRYLNEVYTPDTTLAIQFGNGTTVGGANQDLYLDFFEPQGDVAANRPLIILAFGGSFIGGAREDMHSMCAYYAARGYAAASIDYRLYDIFGIPDSVTMTDVVIKAVSDMKAAVRFFREDAATANVYKVDSNLIFAGGISAGGIVADHVGLLQETNTIQPYIQTILDNNGGWTGNSSTNTQYGDEVAGVLNYSGALKSASYIDANDPPLFSVHDDQDETVPYGTGDAVIFSFPIIELQGSGDMATQANSVGLQNELITITNSTGHVSYFQTQAGTDSILTRSLEFLYPIVCNEPVGIAEQDVAVNIYPNPVSNDLTLAFDYIFHGRVVIVDSYGKRLNVQQFNGTFLKMDVSSLSNGFYWLEFIDENGAVYTKEFVKL